MESLEDRLVLAGAYTSPILANGDGVVASDASFDLRDAAVGVAANGNYVVAYERAFSASDNDLLFQRYAANGSRLGGVTVVNNSTLSEQNVDIAVAPDGHFVVVYEKEVSSGGALAIYLQMFDASGSRTLGETLVSELFNGDQTAPTVAMANNGDFAVTWLDADLPETELDLVLRRYNADGTPKAGATAILEGSTANTVSYLTPDIAINPNNGDMVIAFDALNVGATPDNHDIAFVRVSAGGAVTQGRTYVEGGSDADQEITPAVAMNSDGEFAIAWMNVDSGLTTGSIRARSYNASGTSIGTTQITTSTGAEVPHVVANDADDSWIFAWGSLTGAAAYAIYDTTLTTADLGATQAPSAISDFRGVHLGGNARGDFVIVADEPDTSPDSILGFGRLVDPAGDDPNDSLAEAFDSGAITGAVSVAGLIDPNGDVDMFRFTVAAGQTVTIETSPRGSDPVDTEIRLFDASGVPLPGGVDDDLGPGFYSRLTFTFAAAGTYYVGVSHYQNDTYDPVTGTNDTLGTDDPTGGYLISFTPSDNAQDDVYILGSADSASASVDNVFANDPGTASRAAVLQVQASLGSASVNANGAFTYTPGAGFWGVDAFTYDYRVEAGLLQNDRAEVTVMTHNALQVRKLYNQVLGRGPEPAGWEFWTRQVTAGAASLGTIAAGIFLSPERLDPIVAQMYRDYLLREVDQSGLDFWRGLWQQDGGPENVIAGIVSSPEFFNSAGGTNRLWTTEMYRRLLGREPDTQGLDFWTARLDSGELNRQQVVLGFIQSDENFGLLAQLWFQQYLGRAATNQEQESIVSQLKGRATRRDIQIQIIDSLEYLNSPAPPAAGVAQRA